MISYRVSPMDATWLYIGNRTGDCSRAAEFTRVANTIEYPLAGCDFIHPPGSSMAYRGVFHNGNSYTRERQHNDSPYPYNPEGVSPHVSQRPILQ